MKNFKIASIRRNSFSVQKPSYSINSTGSKFKDWLSSKLFDRLFKWKYLCEYFEDQVVETFDYTESKRKLITEKILEAIQNYKADYRDVTPDNYAVIMGESTFFEYLKEDRGNSPFFGSPAAFMSNDIYYNDPYRGRQVVGFPIHVIPGLQGFALVPKAIIEKKV
jgi:hypothetical protein